MVDPVMEQRQTAGAHRGAATNLSNIVRMTMSMRMIGGCQGIGTAGAPLNVKLAALYRDAATGKMGLKYWAGWLSLGK
jgi:hypothetical protein